MPGICVLRCLSCPCRILVPFIFTFESTGDFLFSGIRRDAMEHVLYSIVLRLVRYGERSLPFLPCLCRILSSRNSRLHQAVVIVVVVIVVLCLAGKATTTHYTRFLVPSTRYRQPILCFLTCLDGQRIPLANLLRKNSCPFLLSPSAAR